MCPENQYISLYGEYKKDPYECKDINILYKQIYHKITMSKYDTSILI
jgi:hypothetical protein